MPITDRLKSLVQLCKVLVAAPAMLVILLASTATDELVRQLRVDYEAFSAAEEDFRSQRELHGLEGTEAADYASYVAGLQRRVFEDCLAVIRHPVVYNGDIRTVGDFKQLSLRFDRVHAWMIGRWCLADPFLPGRITTGADDIPDKIYRMQRFHEALFEAYNGVLYGPSHVLKKMKGLWRYFSLPFEDFGKTMKKIKKTRRTDQYLEQVNLFFETEARLRQPEKCHSE